MASHDPIADVGSIEDEIAQLEANLAAARSRLAATTPQQPATTELPLHIPPKVSSPPGTFSTHFRPPAVRLGPARSSLT
ncbi:hypothetical protein NLG97_g7009 [Lecanicillium saksenae]|uniref:Uncharacterized protein n=1 Tax=Lecanicillium saksenae TaxID=468837 RepID=A0ACC1QN14_9HYPO|nr:hypothetical protein NLG97_g7009 [Lecanicillium saksenae]